MNGCGNVMRYWNLPYALFGVWLVCVVWNAMFVIQTALLLAVRLGPQELFISRESEFTTDAWVCQLSLAENYSPRDLSTFPFTP